MQLPKNIFFTGAPGSKWSGVAQVLEEILDLDVSDRSPEREYSHSKYSGHKGIYYGNGMEFPANLDFVERESDKPYLIKSHDWSFQLREIKERFSGNGALITIFRDPDRCMNWWLEAGGFDITYPNYSFYENENKMKIEICRQTCAIAEYIIKNNIPLEPLNKSWIKKTFDIETNIDFSKWSDLLISYTEL